MQKTQLGILLGIAAGIVDVIPMVLQNITWDANLSAFVFWVVSGYLISTSNLKLNSLVKGVLISFIVLSPCAVIIGWKEPLSLIPISIMTVLLGSTLGFLIEKYGQNRQKADSRQR